MALSKKMQDAINEQIQAEVYSAYLYLSMSAYCEELDLPGMAHWMRMQWEEELIHALKFFDFVNDRGGRVKLLPIEQPTFEFESPICVFEETLKHEQYVTSRIHDLYAIAVEERDYPSQILLQWFIEEQVEEEKTASDLLAVLKRTGGEGHPLVQLDKELAARAAPTPAAEGEE